MPGRTKSIVHEIFLLVGLFLAGLCVHSMQGISEKIEDIRISLAQLSTKMLEHERRISVLEKRN